MEEAQLTWSDLLAIMQEHGVKKVGDLPEEIIMRYYKALGDDDLNEEMD